MYCKHFTLLSLKTLQPCLVSAFCPILFVPTLLVVSSFRTCLCVFLFLFGWLVWGDNMLFEFDRGFKQFFNLQLLLDCCFENCLSCLLSLTWSSINSLDEECVFQSEAVLISLYFVCVVVF